MPDKGKLTVAALFTAVFISLSAGLGTAFCQPPSPPHRVWGDVTYEDGSPAANVTINFVNDAGDVVASDHTNSDGYYDTDLPPGLETNIPEPDDKTLEIYVGDWDSNKVLEWETGGSEEIDIGEVPMPPTVTTESPSDIGTSSATLNMSYDFRDYDSGSVGFKWRESGASWNTTSPADKSGSGSYSTTISGLSSGTDYEFKAQVIYDDQMEDGSVLSFTTATPANEPPIADFSYSPPSPNPGEAVSFDASASSDPDGTIEDYEWTFGDGSSDTGESTTHSYSSTGDYTATLTVEDNAGATNSTSKTVLVVSPTNEPPTADAGGPYSVDEGRTIQLDGTGSGDQDGSVASYSWTVATGPGSLRDSNSAEPTYVAPDDVDSDTTVEVELTVTDDDGGMDTATATITVNDVPATANEPPTASIGGPYSVGEGESVGLDGTGSSDPDGDSLTYSWTITDDPTGGASLSNADSANPTLRAPSVDGGVEITVEPATADAHGHADTDTVTVTVRDVPEEGFPWATVAVILIVIVVAAVAGAWFWQTGRSGSASPDAGGGL